MTPNARNAGERRDNATTADPGTSSPKKSDPVVEMLNKALSDSILRAGLLTCGFLKKNRSTGATEWAAEPAVIAVAMHLSEQYQLDMLQRHLLPLDGKVYTSRDAMVFSAQKSRELEGIEQEEEAVLTDGIGRPVEVDPMNDPEITEEMLTDERRPPRNLEWRVWVWAVRRDAGRYRFRGRYPYWRKRFGWSGSSGSRRRSFESWEPHPYGPEMAVKCGEVACLRRGWNIALPTIDEKGGFDALTDATGGGEILDAEPIRHSEGAVDDLAAELGVTENDMGVDDEPNDPDVHEGAS